jgi:hypothetical protein
VVITFVVVADASSSCNGCDSEVFGSSEVSKRELQETPDLPVSGLAIPILTSSQELHPFFHRIKHLEIDAT